MRAFILMGIMLGSPWLIAGPVQYVPGASLLKEEQQKVVFEGENYRILRSDDAQDQDFRNLYWVNLEDSLFDALTLEGLGHVELYVPQSFAIVNLPTENVEKAAEILHEERATCGQLIRLHGDVISARAVKAVAKPIVPIDQPLAVLPEIQDKVDPKAIQKTVESMVALGTRYGNSAKPAGVTDLLLSLYQGLAKQRADVSFEKIMHAGYSQPSLIVRIQGRKHPEDIIVLGSHIDSINRSGASNKAPGADDNASGTASHLELFRMIMEQNLSFDRTLEIHGYALEELGLIGSQDIARRYVKAGKNVIAMMQNDMNMFRSTNYDMIWLVTNDVDTALNQDVERLIKSYQTVAVDKNRLTAGTSDHRAWNRQGIPVVFPTENPTHYNHNIHTAADVIANSGAFTQSAEFVKLSLSFVAHFAGLQD